MVGKRNQKQAETAAVLDLGSSKVACLIGQVDEHYGVRLLGASHIGSSGLKGGVVVDMEAVAQCVRQAVTNAERQAGVAVHSLTVNYSTRSMHSERLSAQTAFSSGEVAERDVRRLIKTTLSEFTDPAETIFHAIPLNWSVDGERNIQEPRGMFGSNLEVDMHFVLGGIGPLRNLAHCIERCHYRMNSVIVSPYAAGLAVLTEDEKDLGVTVIDFGGGVTSAAIFRDDRMVHVDAIALGGQSVTNDVARGLITPAEAAERIKKIYGSALHGANDDFEMVPCPPMGAQDTLHNEPRSTLTGIIRSRVEETLELLRDRIAEAGLDSYSGRRIVLTGGGAQLTGMRELAEFVFNKRVRIGRPHGILGLPEEFSGPEFAVAAGMLKKEFAVHDEPISGPPDLTGRRYRQKRYTGGVAGQTWQWLRDNF